MEAMSNNNSGKQMKTRTWSDSAGMFLRKLMLALSPSRMRRMAFKFVYELLENAAAVFVIFKLVEAGAGGCEQDEFPGPWGVGRALNRGV